MGRARLSAPRRADERPRLRRAAGRPDRRRHPRADRDRAAGARRRFLGRAARRPDRARTRATARPADPGALAPTYQAGGARTPRRLLGRPADMEGPRLADAPDPDRVRL